MKKILLGIISLLLIASVGYCEEQPLQLIIKSDKEIYKVGEEIWIIVDIKNNSERKQILSALGFIVSSDNIKNPIYSPVKFSDNTFEDNPYKRESAILQSKEKNVLKYNLYNLKWDILSSSLWASKPFNKYIRPGKYSISFDCVIGDQKDYTSRPNYFTSNTITIELGKKDKVQYLSPWANKAPYPYENENHQLVKDSYKEKLIESSVEEYPEAVRKAKEVLKEWGQNPDKYKFHGKSYDYKISVYESTNFISVTFNPIDLDVTCQQVEIRITKDGLEILSILKGP